MTIPSEELRHLTQTQDFLKQLLVLPRIPKGVRIEASRLLKHYPHPLYIEKIWKSQEGFY